MLIKGSGMRFLVIALILFCNSAYATGQMKDKLYLEDTYLLIDNLPLSSYLNMVNGWSNKDQDVICSNNWRGYQASWDIRENHLWLLLLDSNPCVAGYTELPAEKLFGDKNYPIRADWFSGEIIARIAKPQNAMVEAIVYTFDKSKLISRKIKFIPVK